MHILALQPNLISRSGPGPRIYFLGLNGLWGARLDAASVAGFGEGGGVAAAAALPGGPRPGRAITWRRRAQGRATRIGIAG